MSGEQFQVGDLVERVDNGGTGLTIGRRYRVVQIRDGGETVAHLDNHGQLTRRSSIYYRLVQRASEIVEPSPAASPKAATINFKGWGTWA